MAMISVEKVTKSIATGQNVSPLSEVQKRLYFYYKLNPESPVYNLPFCYKIEGILDVKRFKSLLEVMLSKFKMFHVNIFELDGIPYQKYDPERACEIDMLTFPMNRSNRRKSIYLASSVNFPERALNWKSGPSK